MIRLAETLTVEEIRSAGALARIRGILIAVALVIAILAVAFGIVYGIGQIFGGMSVQLSIFWAFVLVAIVIGTTSLTTSAAIWRSPPPS